MQLVADLLHAHKTLILVAQPLSIEDLCEVVAQVQRLPDHKVLLRTVHTVRHLCSRKLVFYMDVEERVDDPAI